MPWYDVIWNHEPGGNVEHLAEHGVTPEEAEEVLFNDRLEIDFSMTTGEPCKFGYTSTGKFIFVVWTEVNDDPRIIYPMTAYEVPEGNP